jgi:uncharacterized protein YbbK (DUF523 family)
MPDSIEILHFSQNDKSNSVCRDAPPRVGVSACLLGQNTRYDGANSLDAVIVETIGPIVELVPVCPEMEIEMGSPRPPIRLVDGPDGLRAIGVDDPAVDVTEALDSIGRRHADLSGFIMKSRSPSCAVGSADVFSTGGGLVSPVGSGVFARSIMKATPLLPMEDETALSDSARRNAFLLRVFAYDRWIRLANSGGGTFGDFVEKTDFARNALDKRTRRRLDSLAALARKDGGLETGVEYAAAFLTALRDAPADGPMSHAADRAVSLLLRRKPGATSAQGFPPKPKKTLSKARSLRNRPPSL